MKKSVRLLFATYLKYRSLLINLVIVLQCAFVLKTSAQPPIITSFSPTSGKAGSAITINGDNFSPTPANNIVYFGAVRGTVTAATPTSLSVVVPTGATYKPITVQVNGLTGYSRQPFVVSAVPGCDPFSTTSLGGPQNYAVGDGPFNMATGDIDGDGKPDIVATNQFSSTFSVLRNISTSGSIVFASKVDFLTGNGPERLSIGNFDGDGKPDVVVANGTSGSVSVFRNLSTPGNISFAPKIDFAAGFLTRSVAIGDVDGDGKIDIAAVNYGSNSISFFRNTSTVGALAFAPKVDVATGNGAHGVQIVDLNIDGKLDIAVLCRDDNKVITYRNNSTPGNIDFELRFEIAVGSGSYGLAFGDFSENGKPDMVVANYGENTVSVYRATSPALDFYKEVDINAGTRPLNIAIGDVNGDGKIDIAVALEDNPSIISVITSTSQNGVISFNDAVKFGNGGQASDVSIIDLDGDGTNDVAAANYFSDVVAVFRNLTKQTGECAPSATVTNATFGSDNGAITITPTAGTAPFAYSIDGGANYVTGGSTYTYASLAAGTYKVRVLSSGGLVQSAIQEVKVRSGCSAPPTITSLSALAGPVGTNLTINGTNFSPTPSDNIVFFGAVRAVVTAATTTTLNVIVPVGASYKPITVTVNELTAYAPDLFTITFNTSNRQIQVSSFGASVEFSAPGPFGVEVIDLDDDGKGDVSVAGGSGSVLVLKNLSSPGSINLGNRLTVLDNDRVTSGLSDIAAGDFNGDGRPDLVAGYFNGNVNVLVNTGNGNIAFAAKIDVPINPYGLAVGDIDEDGKPDIAGVFNGSLWYVRNTSTNGNTSFAAPILIPFGNGQALHVSIADLNNNQKPELVLSGYYNIYILKNTSSGGTVSFDNSIEYPSNGRRMAVGDIDGDGMEDIFAAEKVFRNLSTGNTIAFEEFALPQIGGYFNSLGDLNGDEKPDLVLDARVSNTAPDAIVIIQNNSTPGNLSFAPGITLPTGVDTYTAQLSDLDNDGALDIVVGVRQLNKLVVFRNLLNTGSCNVQLASAPTVTATDCGQSTGTIRIVAGTGNAPFQYSIDAGVTYVAGSDDGYTFMDLPTGEYTLRVKDAAGCESALYVERVSTTCVVPTITSIAPKMSPAGSGITITGTNFSTSPERNIVYFGAVRGYVFAATPTLLNVVVPAGATYEPVSVTVDGSGLTGYSKERFIVTFNNQNTPVSNAFAPPVAFTSIQRPGWATTVSDFDGDGKADIAVTRPLLGTVGVFANTSDVGSINLDQPIGLQVGGDAYGIASDDVDGDGKPDLVVTTTSTLFIFRNISTPGGAINFAPAQQYALSGPGLSVAIGDLNSDGRPDIVVSNFRFTNPSLTVFRNQSIVGAIDFANKVDYAIPGTTPRAVAIEDLDMDGRLDVIVASSLPNSGSSRLSYFRNISAGEEIIFANVQEQNLPSAEPQMIQAGDFDGDNKPDLAISTSSGPVPNSGILMLRNISNPGSFNFVFERFLPVRAALFAIGDVTGDGKVDVIANKEVYINKSFPGQLEFSLKQLFTNQTISNNYVADIDGDGKPDIIAQGTTGSQSIDNGIMYIFRYDPQAVGPICNVLLSTTQVSSSNAACNQNNGTITLTPVNGTAPFQYSINGGTTYVSSPDAGFTFTNLAAGTYQLRLKDANGCESPDVSRTIITVECTDPSTGDCTPPTFLNTPSIVGNASCATNDGQISIIPQSGNPPFAYSIDGGITYIPGPATGYTFFNLQADTYQLRLKDGSGCESDIVVRIVADLGCPPNTCNPPRFSQALNTVGNATCGQSDGQIVILPISGNPPFEYSKDGGTTYVSGPNAGYTFFNLAAGAYQLRVRDAGGCESNIVTRYVQQINCPPNTCTAPTFLNTLPIVGNATCGASDGQISIIPQSGVAPYLYSIDGGITYIPGPATGYTFFNLPAGTYTLRLKDFTGCESAPVTRTVANINCPTTCITPTLLNTMPIVGDATCGRSDGQISLIPTSGVGPFEYSIDGGVTYVSGPNAGYTFFNLPAGTYNLKVRSAIGCESATIQRTVQNRNINCPTAAPTITGISKGFALDENALESKLKVSAYPNPSRGQFKLQVLQSTASKAEVFIYDGKGTLVQQAIINPATNSTINVNLSGKAKGMYHVKVVTRQGISTSKVLLQ